MLAWREMTGETFLHLRTKIRKRNVTHDSSVLLTFCNVLQLLMIPCLIHMLLYVYFIVQVEEKAGDGGVGYDMNLKPARSPAVSHPLFSSHRL